MASLRNDEERLTSLFEAYREAAGEPGLSPDFMPVLWQRIESRRRAATIFRRMATGLATAAAAVSLVLFLLSVPRPSGSSFYSRSYLEVLAEEHAVQSPVYAEPVSVPNDSDTDLLNEML